MVLHNVEQSQDEHQLKSFQKKAEVNHEIQQLKSKMRESQVKLLWHESIILTTPQSQTR